MREITGAAARPAAARAGAVGVSFARDLRRHGGRTALVTPDGSALTYAELADRVDRVRRTLGPTRRLVCIGTSNEPGPLVAYLAALADGHPVLLAPAADPAVGEALRARYDPDVSVSGSDGRLDEHRPGTAHELHPDLALLLSTSGSTGSAKLVRLSHHNLDSNAAAIAEYLDISAEDRTITTLPMHYCYGLSVIHSHLLRGAAIVLTSNSVVDRCFWARVRDHGVTNFAGVPHTFDLLERVGFDSMDLPTLRFLTQAGGRLAPEKVLRQVELAERGGWDFFVMYGQTEATARMAYVPPARLASHPGAIGVPVPGGSFELDPVPGEAHGELVYRGPNVMLGYAHGPEDLAAGRTVQELRTGDLARRCAEDMYEIVGRASRFIKPFGVRVDLDGVERMLSREGFDAVCSGDDERLVVAFEASGPGAQDAAATARAVVQDRLGLPAASLRVHCLHELPRLANGKPDLVALRRLDPQEELGEDPQAIRAVFARVLAVGHIGDDESFVSLGGDSLSYVETSIQIEQVLGFVPDDWHLLPVAELDRIEPRRRHGGRRWRRMETNVVVRAVAIVLIVGTHTTVFRQQGGAHLLFALAGLNFARFQLGGDDGAERTRRNIDSITRIAVPTLAFTWLAMATREGFSASNVLLVNNYAGSGPWWYWYVEALLQVLVVLAALFAVPAVRRAERQWPFGFALALLVPLLVVRFGFVEAGGFEKPTVTAHVIAWLFVLGWAVQRAASAPQRLLVSLLVVAALPGFFGDGSRELVVAAGLLLVMWVPHLAVPPPLQHVAGTLAGSSLYIYLTHFFIYRELRDTRGPVVAAAASILLGVAVWLAVERTRRLAGGHLRARLSSLRDTGGAWLRSERTPST